MEIRDPGTLLTTSEAARVLHVHVSTVRRWSDRGLLHAYRVGRRGDRRFHPDEIARFMAASHPPKGK